MEHTTRTDYDGAATAWTCARKRPYQDERAIKHTVAVMQDEGKDVTYYACTRCGAYHIGRAPADAPYSEPRIDHPYFEETGKSPRRICCARPREEHL